MLKKLFFACILSITSSLVLAQSAADAVRVALHTNKGTIVLELDNQKAPNTVKNFVQYVDDHFYDGTIFHRVIDGFMIQGGGFTPDMIQKTTRPPIRNESYNGLRNESYTIAMARTNDPNSATAQFFINVKNNAFLNKGEQAGYAVFGRVIEGKDVVDIIKGVETGRAAGMTDVPLTPVIIEKAEVLK